MHTPLETHLLLYLLYQCFTVLLSEQPYNHLVRKHFGEAKCSKPLTFHSDLTFRGYRSMCVCVCVCSSKQWSQSAGIDKERIKALINTHQSSADQIFIQEVRGENRLPVCLATFLLQVCLQMPGLSVFVIGVNLSACWHRDAAKGI